MLVHTVLFWLRKDLKDDELTKFRSGLEALKNIDGLEAVYIGSPAATPERPVIVQTYDYCLTTVFKDVEAHNAYQMDPRHIKFIEQCSSYWERVQIYDAD